jgi:hypothetical protein
MVPGADSRTFFCLYDFDTDLRLLRFDTTASYVPFPSTMATGSSCLPVVVLSSPWRVEEAKIDDWRRALDYLKKSPQSFRRGAFGLGGSKSAILARLTAQVKLMSDNGATEWPVTVTYR